MLRFTTVNKEMRDCIGLLMLMERRQTGSNLTASALYECYMSWLTCNQQPGRRNVQECSINTLLLLSY